jgi:hypothetical protein
VSTNHLPLEEFHSTHDHVIQHPLSREPVSKMQLTLAQVEVKPANLKARRRVVALVQMLHDGDAKFLEALQYLEDARQQQEKQPLHSNHQLMQAQSLVL